MFSAKIEDYYSVKGEYVSKTEKSNKMFLQALIYGALVIYLTTDLFYGCSQKAVEESNRTFQEKSKIEKIVSNYDSWLTKKL